MSYVILVQGDNDQIVVANKDGQPFPNKDRAEQEADKLRDEHPGLRTIVMVLNPYRALVDSR